MSSPFIFYYRQPFIGFIISHWYQVIYLNNHVPSHICCAIKPTVEHSRPTLTFKAYTTSILHVVLLVCAIIDSSQIGPIVTSVDAPKSSTILQYLWPIIRGINIYLHCLWHYQMYHDIIVIISEKEFISTTFKSIKYGGRHLFEVPGILWPASYGFWQIKPWAKHVHHIHTTRNIILDLGASMGFVISRHIWVWLTVKPVNVPLVIDLRRVKVVDFGRGHMITGWYPPSCLACFRF